MTAAFILHTRPYRETSLIADFLTLENGRVSGVVRGARGKSKRQLPVQPFVPLTISLFGRTDLKTIRTIETTGRPSALHGERLIIGLYVNELLVRLVREQDPNQYLFAAYALLLSELESGASPETPLRTFELTLLAELGYGIVFDREILSGEPILPDTVYRYRVEEGFAPMDVDQESGFRGADLLAIAAGDLDSVGNTAKKIVRQTIGFLLGDKKLHSRDLFRDLIRT